MDALYQANQYCSPIEINLHSVDCKQSKNWITGSWGTTIHTVSYIHLMVCTAQIHVVLIERSFYKKEDKLYLACNDKKGFSLLKTIIEDITLVLSECM